MKTEQTKSLAIDGVLVEVKLDRFEQNLNLCDLEVKVTNLRNKEQVEKEFIALDNWDWPNE